jgi:hypothetical protein
MSWLSFFLQKRIDSHQDTECGLQKYHRQVVSLICSFMCADRAGNTVPVAETLSMM